MNFRDYFLKHIMCESLRFAGNSIHDKARDIHIPVRNPDTYFMDLEVYRSVDYDNKKVDIFAKENEIIAYVIHCSIGRDLYINGIWRSPDARGILYTIIKEFYPTIYDTVTSGDTFNESGKRFWLSLAKDFISQGKRVTWLVYSVIHFITSTPDNFEMEIDYATKPDEYFFMPNVRIMKTEGKEKSRLRIYYK